MNSIDLKLIISSDYKLSKTFRGVFAYNKLPSIVSSFPSSYIVNTDIAKKKGEHWIALYFTSPELCEIFDSYGMQPFGRIYTFASNNADCVLYNKMFYRAPFLVYVVCIVFIFYTTNRGVIPWEISYQLHLKIIRGQGTACLSKTVSIF